jgi:hypothetical protein
MRKDGRLGILFETRWLSIIFATETKNTARRAERNQATVCIHLFLFTQISKNYVCVKSLSTGQADDNNTAGHQ